MCTDLHPALTAASRSAVAASLVVLAGCPIDDLSLVSLDASEPRAVGQDAAGGPPDCDDGNPCTYDWLDSASGRCRHAARSGGCDDSNRCTEHDRCLDGVCSGDAIACDDGIDCTLDYCDPAAGCAALPDSARCGASGDPCRVAICDPATGCSVVAAVDGTECGPRSCAELAVCVAGQCRSGPAPDGLPCDDGDPCTTGDRCSGGHCLATSHGTFGVAVPTEVDLGSDVSDHALPEPPSAVAVLAIGATSAGGIDVVWAHHLVYLSDLSVIVLRTRIGPDLGVARHQHLARAEEAWAAFAGDLLVLLTYNYGDCEPLEAHPDQPPEWAGYNACGLVLHQFPAVESSADPVHRLPLNAVFSEIAGATVYGDGPALAVDAEEAYVAIPKQTFDPVGWSLGIVRVSLLDHTTRTSLLPIDRSEGPIPFRHLRLTAADGLSAIAYECAADELALPPGCVAVCSDQALDSALCEQPLYRPILSLPRAGLPPAAIDLRRPRSRSLAFSPALAGGGVLLHAYDPAQNGPLGGAAGESSAAPAPPVETCPVFDRISAFVLDAATGSAAITDLFVDGPGTVRALTAASLFGSPAALWHRSDGWIAIAGNEPDGTPVSIAISHPQSAVSHVDRRFASWTWSPFAPAATAAIGQGFVAALVVEDNPERWASATSRQDAGTPDPLPEWTPNGIALLTAGCGVAIPPFMP
ncbi:MAG: hypothetical protein JXR83_03990 [Deltaproteobacteria bacterium]|nr:hypothetical protein [Deltaproteobacteria bacterium]